MARSAQSGWKRSARVHLAKQWLAECDPRCGERDSAIRSQRYAIPVGETLAELGLQVSNQGRFDEAQALFQRATPIVEGAATPALRARLASYRALDAANRRAFDEALTYARQATAARRAEVEAATR